MYWDVHEDFERLSSAAIVARITNDLVAVFWQPSQMASRYISRLELVWRVSPHCTMVNLVRSGRKQPQPIGASAGGKARLLMFEGVTLDVF